MQQGGHIEGILSEMFSNPSIKMHYTENMEHSITDMRRGDCVATVVSKMDAHKEIGNNEACDLAGD